MEPTTTPSSEETIHRRTVRLNDSSARIIEEYAYHNHVSQNEAINQIIGSFDQSKQEETQETALVNKILSEWDRRYGATLAKIKTSTNFTDIGVEVLRLLMGTLCEVNGIQGEDVRIGEATSRAEEMVRASIQQNKQKYDNKR